MRDHRIQDLDGFDAELEEGRRKIAAERQATVQRTGHLIAPARRQWLRQQIRNSVRGRR